MKNIILFLFLSAWLLLLHYPILPQENSTRMRISTIFVKTKTEAEQIFIELNEGENFAEMARKRSIGPGKEKGGDLGYFALEEMMAGLGDVAAKLQVELPTTLCTI